VVAVAAPSAAPMRFSLPVAMLDVTNSLAQPGNVRVPLAETNLQLEIVNWSTAPTTNEQPGEFILRFRRPTNVGTIIAYEPGTVSYSNNQQWNTLPPPEAPARKLQVLQLPPDVMLDALKFIVPVGASTNVTTKETSYRATLPFVSLLPIRAMNIAPEARATASSTNTADRPSALVDGFVDAKQNFATAKRASLITSNAPEWIQLTWDQPRTFRGVSFFFGAEEKGLGNATLESFIGTGNPLASTGANDWEEIKGRASMPGQFRANQFFVFYENLDTRALRVKCGGGTDQMGLGELAVFAFLGSSAVPVPKPAAATNAEPKVAPPK